MKQKFLLIIVFSLLAATAFSQTGEARKIFEFGNVNCEEYLAAVDVMIGQTNNLNSKIYVFVYEGKERRPVYKNGEFVNYKSVLPQFGLVKARIKSMKKRLTYRKSPLENYVFVNGGFRKDFGVEIWLIPNGVEPPKPTLTLEKMKYRRGKPSGFCLDCCGL